MKKLLSILGAVGLTATSSAASMSVVSCANPKVIHNTFGKELVDENMFNNAITNWTKYNSDKGSYIYSFVNMSAGMNISQEDLASYETNGIFELKNEYKILIIDHFSTTLEDLNLIPIEFGLDYTQFEFSNWVTSDDEVGNDSVSEFGPKLSKQHYEVEIKFKGSDTSVKLYGSFFHEDVVTQTKNDQASYEKGIEEYNRVTNGSSMMTPVDPTGIGFFVALDFVGSKTPDGRFNTTNTTSLKDMQQKSLDFMSMLMREYGIYDETLMPSSEYFKLGWDKAIGNLAIEKIEGDKIFVSAWTGNTAFGTPLTVGFDDSDFTWKVGGSYLPAGVYDFN